MQAIRPDQSGRLQFVDVPAPAPGPREVLVRVQATALNRADLLQRQGKYPPPPGVTDILGLEMAGEVVEAGEQVRACRVGDRVCALLPGGGYAEYATVHEDMLLPVPEGMSLAEAAAIPEAFLTAFQALQWLGRLASGERVLIHAGASGVGTAAIQLARWAGAEPLITASAPKHEGCLELGAALAIDYRTENFCEAVLAYTQGEGVEMVLDFIGAPYWTDNLNCLRTDGRLVLLAFMGGRKAEGLDLGLLLRKRLHLMGSTLRARSPDYKIELTRAFRAWAWKGFGSGQLRPVVDSILEWEKAAEAHAYMEANKNQGKIVLEICR